MDTEQKTPVQEHGEFEEPLLVLLQLFKNPLGSLSIDICLNAIKAETSLDWAIEEEEEDKSIKSERKRKAKNSIGY